MRRGEIWAVNFQPVVGAEADKPARPAVIVSNDGRNIASERTRRGVITVVPLTGSTGKVYDFQVLLRADARNGLTKDSKAQAEQIRAVDVSRLGERLGALSAEQVAALDEALAIHHALG